MTGKNLSDILSRLNQADNEFIQCNFQDEPPCGWDTHRHNLFCNGSVWGFYQERDPQLIQFIQEFDSAEALKEEIRKNLHTEKRALSKAEQDIMNMARLEVCQIRLDELDSLPFNDWICKHANWAQTIIDVPDDDLLGFLYIHFRYENYKDDIKSPYNSALDKIKSLYEGRFNKESQFNKYELIPIDSERKLLPIKWPRIYDRSIDKTLFVKNVPLELLAKLYELQQKHLVGNLAIRVKNNYLNGYVKMVPLEEELERGRVFSLSNLGDIEITKLYSKQYEDQLWINATDTDITFEELCDDFETYKDSIVTQVLHLQFSMINSEPCITHLDHEYVFYSSDDFEKRKHNAWQKGTNQRRLKSFKVDNACIPFSQNYSVSWIDNSGERCPEVSVPFLCYVLNCYFRHTDLLKEYFSIG